MAWLTVAASRRAFLASLGTTHSMISARRTNTAIALVVALLLVVTIVVAVFGTPTSAPTVNDVTTTVVTSDSTLPSNNNQQPSTSFRRRADTSDSWFSHTFAVEQFDFPMDELDCTQMAQYFTMELCVVAATPRGDFMVTATEGFWDAQSNDDNSVDIPLNFMVYVHTTDNGPARAMSVLDGTVSAPYGTATSQVTASTFSLVAGDVVVLEWSSADENTRIANKTWTALQVLAMGDGGLPEVVATYGGTDMSVASDSESLVLTAERFGPPLRNEQPEPWLTVLRLSPSKDNEWEEAVTSQSVAQFDDSDLQEPSSTSTYEFPRRRTNAGAN